MKTPAKPLVSAFTLVELMIAAALTSVLAMVLFSILSGISDAYKVTEVRADTFGDARAALQVLTREINQLIVVPPKLPLLANTNPASANFSDASQFNPSGVPPGFPPPPATPPQPVTPLPPPVQLGILGEAAAVDPTGVETHNSFGFFTKVAATGQPKGAYGSEVCLVGYFMATNPDAPGTSLYRSLIPSTTAFHRLTPGGSTGPTTYFTSDDLKPTSPNAEPVSNNVLNFTVAFRDANMQPVTKDAATAAEQAGAPIVTYIEVALTVIGGRSASVYFDPATGDNLKQKIKAQQTRTFTLRWKLANAI